MKLTVDKRLIKAGNVVEVSWDAGTATSPRIVIHTHNRESILSVPQTGTKRFRMKNSQGQHWIALKAWEGNTETVVKRRIVVYGTAQQNDSFEYMDNHNSWWNRKVDAVKRWWNSFTTEKKRLYIILLMLIAYQILFSFGFFYVCHLLLTLLIFYIFWQVIKRN